MDNKILEALQNEFPLCEKPYEVIAAKLGISCDEFWQRFERLRAEGVIRRMGASLDSRNLGYSGTLAAVSVPAEAVDKAAEIIGRFSEVTHSYLRKDAFNIWFTIIAENEERIGAILEEIQGALSLEESEVLNLPVKRLFKLDARFKSPEQ